MTSTSSSIDTLAPWRSDPKDLRTEWRHKFFLHIWRETSKSGLDPDVSIPDCLWDISQVINSMKTLISTTKLAVAESTMDDLFRAYISSRQERETHDLGEENLLLFDQTFDALTQNSHGLGRWQKIYKGQGTHLPLREIVFESYKPPTIGPQAWIEKMNETYLVDPFDWGRKWVGEASINGECESSYSDGSFECTDFRMANRPGVTEATFVREIDQALTSLELVKGVKAEETVEARKAFNSVLRSKTFEELERRTEQMITKTVRALYKKSKGKRRRRKLRERRKVLDRERERVPVA